eukprot:UC1_evm1s1514
MDEATAGRIITDWWVRYHRRRVFLRLKAAVRSAEAMLTDDILRQLCPGEREILRDPSISATVRLRFGGERWPPQVLFKVYLAPREGAPRVQYMAGKDAFAPASPAMADALLQMGPRKMLDLMRTDAFVRSQG